MIGKRNEQRRKSGDKSKISPYQVYCLLIVTCSSEGVMSDDRLTVNGVRRRRRANDADDDNDEDTLNQTHLILPHHGKSSAHFSSRARRDFLPPCHVTDARCVTSYPVAHSRSACTVIPSRSFYAMKFNNAALIAGYTIQHGDVHLLYITPFNRRFIVVRSRVDVVGVARRGP